MALSRDERLQCSSIAAKSGAIYRHFTARDLRDPQIEFDNWLQLLRAINAVRARNISRVAAQLAIRQTLEQQGSATFANLVDRASQDRAIAMAAVGELLQSGVIEADLRDEPLLQRTVFKLAGDVRWMDHHVLSCAETQDYISVKPEPTQSRSSESEDERVLVRVSGRPRKAMKSGIPPVSSWDEIDKSQLKDPDDYDNRLMAVDMYQRGVDGRTIKEQTGFGVGEASKFFDRCVKLHPDGRIYGSRALVKYARTKPYTRTKEISHFKGDGSCGCSGALGHLLSRPQNITLVADLQARILKPSLLEQTHGSLMARLHNWFVDELIRRGYGKSEWPLSSADRARKSLREYAKRFALENNKEFPPPTKEQKWNESIGTSVGKLVEPRIPLMYVELDYQLIDAASQFRIRNVHQQCFVVVVPRWYVGFLACALTGAVLGDTYSLEKQVTADTALDALQSSIDEPRAIDGCIPSGDADRYLIHHFIPEIQFHAFTVLRIDNAFANLSRDFANNAISTFGCFLQYGAPRAWWRRSLIESVIGAIDLIGIKGMPSTYGTGPKDPARQEPEKKAVKYDIEIVDLIHVIRLAVIQHNVAESSARNQRSTALARVQHAFATPSMGCFVQPLPQATIKEPRLLCHIATGRIAGRGSSSRRAERYDARRGYFKIPGDVEYSNPQLASHRQYFHRRYVAYISRRDFRTGHLFVEQSEGSGIYSDVGTVKAAGGWGKYPLSWQFFCLLRKGDYLEGGDALKPVQQWKADQTAKAKKNAVKNGKTPRPSGAALPLAKHESEVEKVCADAQKTVHPKRRTPEIDATIDVFGVFPNRDNP